MGNTSEHAAQPTAEVEEVRIDEALVRGLDLSRPVSWAKCPFCGGHLAYGHGGTAWEVRHQVPQCAAYQVTPGCRAFIERANAAGARWARVTPQFVEAHGREG